MMAADLDRLRRRVDLMMTTIRELMKKWREMVRMVNRLIAELEDRDMLPPGALDEEE